MKPAYITGAERLSERFNKIRDAYAYHARMVAAGEESWMHGDPYAIADSSWTSATR
ncbi:hypothetical protein C7416_104449 [Cupriavidus phytorum]|uniref:Uncharacterized protein n=1 Tax=Cupriavidus phytorum TaxID=3024399 RepID=A0A2W7P006_9BURK|nr:hypothetical protein C7416_104449 [Cupriavidus alkaliphilus]